MFHIKSLIVALFSSSRFTGKKMEEVLSSSIVIKSFIVIKRKLNKNSNFVPIGIKWFFFKKMNVFLRLQQLQSFYQVCFTCPFFVYVGCGIYSILTLYISFLTESVLCLFCQVIEKRSNFHFFFFVDPVDKDSW